MAGLMVTDQYIAAITDTNTTVLETGSAGIFGLGFPAIRSVSLAREPSGCLDVSIVSYGDSSSKRSSTANLQKQSAL